MIPYFVYSKKGDLVCLEGPVGGGKSSVLSAILAELSLTDGQIFLSDISQGTRTHYRSMDAVTFYTNYRFWLCGPKCMVATRYHS